ncbi:MAG: Fic family protein [bacterium]
MFIPKYTLTPTILANISNAERFYGNLESLHVPKKFELNLERDHLIKSAYISNSMEGNPLSLPEVTNLLLGDRVPVNREEKEIRNYFEILKSLEKARNSSFDLETIYSIHKELMRGVNDKIAGKIRNTPVIVGQKEVVNGVEKIKIKHKPPYYKAKDIKTHLSELINWIAKNDNFPAILKAGIFHHQFVFLHPFVDGNGRTCRLLTALVFLKSNFNINKYFILDDYYDIDRFLYSDKLHTADSGNKTEWLEYFSTGVKYSLQSALSRLESQVYLLPAAERLSAKEKEVLKLLQERKEITSNTLSEIKNVSRQQAQNLLASLVEKGFARKEGTTKGSFYILK